VRQLPRRDPLGGCPCAPILEPMEPRLLLDSHPVLTEFMADNGTGLETRIRASAGDPFEGDPITPDWIEIYNPTVEDVALDEYFLTDDADAPAQWQFPAGQTLGPGEYLVVYASGEDITDPALDETGCLHTNFGLRAAGGEDLVLSYYDATSRTTTRIWGSTYPSRSTSTFPSRSGTSRSASTRPRTSPPSRRRTRWPTSSCRPGPSHRGTQRSTRLPAGWWARRASGSRTPCPAS